MGQPVVHWELMSKEPAKVADFYAKIFGWKVQHLPAINYRLVQTGAKLGINGGIVQPDREGPWPGMGWLSLFTDPEGRMNGLWKPKASKRAAKRKKR